MEEMKNSSFENDVQPSLEQYPSEPLPYNGSQVVSSENRPSPPVQSAKNPEETSEPGDNEKAENNEPYNEIIEQNKQLIQQINQYHHLMSQIFTSQEGYTQEQAQEKPNKTDKMPDKENIVNDVVQIIENKRVYQEKEQKLKTENPDIFSDPTKEYLVSALAIQNIDKGMDFDTSVNEAIKAFRGLYAPKEVISKEKNNSNSVQKTVERQFQQNLFIEGASPQLPESSYRASELMEMQINHPEKYRRLQPEIMQAYKEGRVIFD